MRNRLLELIQMKEQRENRMIPQRQIARELGMSVNTLRKWIAQDVQKYDQETISKICLYFEVSDIADVLTLEVIEEPA